MRIANHQIDGYVSSVQEFTNYNGTITAVKSGDIYRITHWRTTVFEYDMANKKVVRLYSSGSQTTSTLIGRILRNLPDRSAILDGIAALDAYDKKRYLRMLRH